jgi:hypothetical protein
MLYRAINQDGGYSARRLTRIDEPPLTQWAMATRLHIIGPLRGVRTPALRNQCNTASHLESAC